MSTLDRCACTHYRGNHNDDGCRAGGCECLAFVLASKRATAAVRAEVHDSKPELLTLEAAKAWVMQHRDVGVECPACGQLAKIYNRSINAGIARALIELHNVCGQEWANLHTVVGSYSNHAASAAWWGLIEEHPERRDDGGRGKAWRLTDDGVRYVRDQLRVPKYAQLYDGRVLGVGGEPVGIRDALAERFDYAELMGSLL